MPLLTFCKRNRRPRAGGFLPEVARRSRHCPSLLATARHCYQVKQLTALAAAAGGSEPRHEELQRLRDQVNELSTAAAQDQSRLAQARSSLAKLQQERAELEERLEVADAQLAQYQVRRC